MKTIAALLLLLAPISIADPSPAAEKTLAEVKKRTGLIEVGKFTDSNSYLHKKHRGYEVIYVAGGNIWEQSATQTKKREFSPERQVFVDLIKKQQAASGVAPNSSLTKALDHPLSLTIVLTTGKSAAPRLDIGAKGETDQPERAFISKSAGAIYSADAAFARRLTRNKGLMERLKKLRGHHIMVDSDDVSFFWSGTEEEYSALIRDHGGHATLVSSILDNLADVADAIPAQ